MSYEGQDDFISLFPARQPSPEPYREERTPDRTTEQKLRLMISVILRFFGYPPGVRCRFGGCAHRLSFYGTHDHLAHWPRIIAEVNSCDVDQTEMVQAEPTINKSFSYSFHCQVIYGPRSLSQHSVADIGYQTSNRGEMWVLWSNRIHRGDQVEIIYNPSHPEHANFAGDFSIAYAPPLHNLKYTLWLGLIAFAMLFLARKLRPPGLD